MTSECWILRAQNGAPLIVLVNRPTPEWFEKHATDGCRLEHKQSTADADEAAFTAWVLATYQTVSWEYGRLTWYDSGVGAAVQHARNAWYAALKHARAQSTPQPADVRVALPHP